MSPSSYQFHAAIQDFQSAHLRGGLEEVLARVRGRSNDLLSYDEVAQKLKLRARSDAGIQFIPVAAIVGSTGRYTDFTRTFLPRNLDDQERWARVKAAFLDAETALPPIEVYKVGEVYFVIDGNHRVSIARQERFETIEAHVIEVRTDIALTPDVQPDDLIIKAEYAEFLDATHIMDLRPNVDLSVTACCQYGKLLEQICVQECLLELDSKSEIPFREAVEDWYDHIYTPLAEAIRDRGLLRWFPGRTLTDLYLWISENRSALEKELGWEIQSDRVRYVPRGMIAPPPTPTLPHDVLRVLAHRAMTHQTKGRTVNHAAEPRTHDSPTLLATTHGSPRALLHCQDIAL